MNPNYVLRGGTLVSAERDPEPLDVLVETATASKAPLTVTDQVESVRWSTAAFEESRWK